jgi:hypothetical protein
MQQQNDNLLFRWFVGLSVDDPVWLSRRSAQPDFVAHNANADRVSVVDECVR